MRARGVLVSVLAAVALLGAGGAAESAITVLGNDAPTWSSDGREIAFTAFRHGLGEIYVMNANGRSQRRLTRNNAHDDHAAWSPDGRRIAFMSKRDGNAEIYVMNADGSGQVRLTNDPKEDYFPVWSSDGTRIAWRTDRDGNAEIYVMNADGSDQRRITNHPRADTAPDWSRDGRIVFASNRAGTPNFNIYVMNEDGSNVRRVTTSQQNQDQPDISPDGTRIMYVADRDATLGQADIFAVGVDGTGTTRITESEGRDDWPAFSPDGSRVLFTRGLSFRTPEIFVANADGSRAVRLTTSGPQLEVVYAHAEPLYPTAGTRWTTEIEVADVRGAPLARTTGYCRASIGRVSLRLLSRRVDGGFVRCTWAIPRSARGKRLNGVLGLRMGSRKVDFPFSLRIV